MMELSMNISIKLLTNRVAKKFLLFSSFILLMSCSNTKRDEITDLLCKWEQYEVLFPKNVAFTIQGRDTIDFFKKSNFKIVSYIDSEGCTICKMKLHEWSEFITYLDSSFLPEIPIYFFYYPKDLKEILSLLRHENFRYPICLDMNDSFNKLNHFPSDMRFQTFLLDKDNKVLAIGNPIHNPKVKELYLNIIQGKELQPNATNSTSRTSVSVDNVSVSLGYFNWQEEQKTSFVIKNTGSKSLVIQNVNTSCGCTTVSYSKEPVQPGKEIKLDITYKADHPEHFSKTITVYCNAESSPIRLTISGDAE